MARLIVAFVLLLVAASLLAAFYFAGDVVSFVRRDASASDAIFCSDVSRGRIRDEFGEFVTRCNKPKKRLHTDI